MRKFLLGIALLGILSAEEEEIAFEETCERPCYTHRHCRPHPTPEEEYLWHERASSEWPGKRDDNLIDQFLHQ